MRKLIGLMLLAAAPQIHAQPLEADLDGNASSLQASEMKSQPRAKSEKTQRERIAAR